MRVNILTEDEYILTENNPEMEEEHVTLDGEVENVEYTELDIPLYLVRGFAHPQTMKMRGTLVGNSLSCHD